MSAPKRMVPLLHGPYTPPDVKKGDSLNCLFRNGEAVVTSWSDGPISWPRGYVPVGKVHGGPGIIIEGELARAVACESAVAIQYWWGVSSTSVNKWRKALGVTRTNCEGSQVLIHAATAKALAAARETELSEEECRRRSRLASSLRIWENSPDVTYGVAWLPEQVALLGTAPDREVARLTNHSLHAVRNKRRQLRIPGFRKSEAGS
jgi:hypothetical protein